MPRYIRERYGYCQRSGKRLPRRLMVEDGDVPGLMVDPKWYEPEHPQERLEPLGPDDLRPELTEPPLEEERLKVSLPDFDLQGNQATYYRFGDATSVSAALSGDVALYGALYQSGTDFSTLSAYTATSEVSGAGYVAGGYEVAYELRNYGSTLVVWIEDFLTDLPVTLDSIGGLLLYVADGQAQPAIVAIQFRAVRETTGRRVNVLFPTATPNIGVAVFTGS